MVSMPFWLAVSKARSRLAELPLVDRPIAMSFLRPKAASCREKTTSTPMSSHSAVSSAVSLPSANPGLPLLRNSVASCWASVALPPLPNANSRPPAANRAAAARAHSAIRAPSPAHTVRRSSLISSALATVDARTWASTADRFELSAYRNGYRASRSLMAGVHYGDGFLRVHQDGVAYAGAHQGHADRLRTGAGVDNGHLVLEQLHHPHLYRGVGTGDADLPLAFAHVSTPGPSTPGCSKNTWTSSHSTWYAVTCTSLTTRGSREAATSTWSAALLAAIAPPSPPVRAPVSRPSSRAAASPASTAALCPSGSRLRAMSAGPARNRIWWAKIASTPERSAIPVTVATSVVSEMAGSARLPTITGWTNSTATCCASVLAPPVPNTTSFPPEWNRTAIAWQAAATASACPARSRVGAVRSSNSRTASSPSVTMTATVGHSRGTV